MHVSLQGGELVRKSDIARNYGISQNHLTKVVHKLGTLGYLKTVQGRKGGIRLARSAEEIGVGEVVRDFEPDFNLVECHDPETSHCRIQSACLLQDVLLDAMQEFLRRLDQTTLAALVRPRLKLQKLLDLPIKAIAKDASVMS